jgi:hypothetical protein
MNLREQLASTQESAKVNTGDIPEPKANLVAAPNNVAQVKALSELSKLKAENHRLKMINQMLSDDNYKMRRSQEVQRLKQQQSELELELATECETIKKFDWNTLSFNEPRAKK